MITSILSGVGNLGTLVPLVGPREPTTVVSRVSEALKGQLQRTAPTRAPGCTVCGQPSWTRDWSGNALCRVCVLI